VRQYDRKTGISAPPLARESGTPILLKADSVSACVDYSDKHNADCQLVFDENGAKKGWIVSRIDRKIF
jgi:hypothetical protein